MLCELARSFPPKVAALLERDRGLKRNFREETVTDLLMAGLVALEPFGIKVYFPNEPTTGGDMEWIFAAPLEVNGGRYFRFILQAKRAQFAALKSGGYWYYHHLDHGDPPGQQAKTLVGHAASSTPATLPLYVFYHPTSALLPAAPKRPAVEGVNLVFAHHVEPVVIGGCSKQEKKVDHWRDRFMPLSDLLCWPTILSWPTGPAANATQFMIGRAKVSLPEMVGGFHPDLVAERFRKLREVTGATGATEVPEHIEPVDGIPPAIRRAIDGTLTAEDRQELIRPRVIFSTKLRRSDPGFSSL